MTGRSILEAERIRAAELDAQILDLEQSLSALRVQRSLIQKRLDSVRYPILTLPNEIVSEIFLHFLPVYPECPPLTGILSPTNLTHICRKWREVALTTPTLWRAVRFRFSASPGQTHASEMMYLGMSGCCALSIETEKPSDILRRSVDDTNIFAILAPHRARWEYLTLHRVALPRHSLLELGHPMPMLRHLSLPFDDTEDSVDPLIFGEAPLLRSVILEGSLHTFVLPWAQLTSVTLQFVSLHGCAPVLRQTANLTYCRLYLVFSHQFQNDLGPDVTLLRLESLIVDPRSERVDGVLAIFVVPALRHLEISEYTLGSSPVHSLISFISKSACKLQEARIMGGRNVSAETYSRAFPSVELSFDGPYFGEGIDVAMGSEASSSDPELESGSDGE